MIPELNKNEFLRVKRALDDARELNAGAHYKSALFTLKPAIAQASRSPSPFRLQALLYQQRAAAYKGLKDADAALEAYKTALRILNQIGDQSSLIKEIETEINLLS